MARCRLPKICEKYKIDIGIFDLKSKRCLPRSVKQRDVCAYIHENQYCDIWKNNRKDFLLSGMEQFVRKLKNVKIKINKKI